MKQKIHYKYKTEVEIQLVRKIKRGRSDRKGEYGPDMLKRYYAKQRISYE